MVLDHVGLYLFPDAAILRFIGRSAMPIFAWLIANGANKTGNLKNYLLKILAVAVISQPIIVLLNYQGDPWSVKLNVIFTYAVSLLVIYLSRLTKSKPLVLTVVLCAAIFLHTTTEYGLIPLLFILFAYRFPRSITGVIVFFIVTSTLYNYFPIYSKYIIGSGHNFEISFIDLIDPVGFLGLVPLFFYRGKLGPRMKIAFYLFYPAHLFVIYLITQLGN